MPPRRRLTIREVARAAGVSTQTVSRVLNNRPDVSRATFERVQQVIADTGYAPNMLARGLTQGRSHILGIVAYGLEYFGPSRVLTGVEHQAADLGYSMSLNLVHDPATDDVDSLLSSLVSRQVDGIIWAIPEVGQNRAWLDVISPDFPVPVMLVGGMDGQTVLRKIVIDNIAIGRVATEHLLAGGVRNVGIVTGPLDWWESRQRLIGWRETLEAHGLPVSDDLRVAGDWSANSGERACYQLLRQRPDIEAIFASNDQMALGVLHAAHRLGRRVPDDLSIVGVDDFAEASQFWPSLTTVSQPLREAGALAVCEIDESIRTSRLRRAPDAPTRETGLLKPALIVRDSSRPVAEPTVGGSGPDVADREPVGERV